MKSISELEQTKINFIEFLKPNLEKGGKVSVKDAVLNLMNLKPYRQIREKLLEIPVFYDEFEQYLLKLDGYDKNDLTIYLDKLKYVLTEDLISHKETIGILLKTEYIEQADLVKINIDFKDQVIRHIERGIRFIDHQLLLNEKRKEVPKEIIEEERAEIVIQKVKTKKIKVDLNQFEFALLLTILKEKGVFPDYIDSSFKKDFKEVIMDNFLCLNPDTEKYEVPRSLDTIFPQVYSHVDRRRDSMIKISNEIEEAFITLAEKCLVDIRKIKFERR
jgi:hypothetical protein